MFGWNEAFCVVAAMPKARLTQSKTKAGQDESRNAVGLRFGKKRLWQIGDNL